MYPIHCPSLRPTEHYPATIKKEKLSTSETTKNENYLNITLFNNKRNGENINRKLCRKVTKYGAVWEAGGGPASMFIKTLYPRIHWEVIKANLHNEWWTRCSS